MSRGLGIVCCLLAGLAVLGRAGDEKSRVPHDTLPARLSLTAVPVGLDPRRPIPADNPLTEAKVLLGRRLFFDPLLSENRTVACATCHDPARGFTTRDPVAVGVHGRRGTRNSPSLLNRAYATTLFWDGRETTLEAQALRPLEDPLEMGTTVAEVVKRLGDNADYRAQFAAAFPDGVSAANLGKALASFQRTLLLGASKVDRFRVGETAALNAGELHGLWLFESRGKCWKCHAGRNFTDESFHNTGVGWGKEPLDLGRYAVTKRDVDRGKFKTPTLRGVAQTAPYMHDGSLATLEEVVEFYNRGGGKNPHVDPFMEPLGLTQAEVQDLVAFLKALSGAAGEGR